MGNVECFRLTVRGAILSSVSARPCQVLPGRRLAPPPLLWRPHPPLLHGHQWWVMFFIDIFKVHTIAHWHQHRFYFSLSPLAPCSSSLLPGPLSDVSLLRRGMKWRRRRRRVRRGTSTQAWRTWRRLIRFPNCPPQKYMEIVGGHDLEDVMKNCEKCSCLLRIYLKGQN